ncbi:MAG: invasion associated locus B family protein [Xanthobacteraceae bacterium]|nr:invasion associated locus B family protein [Xanthobacteraceae bacterium]
MKLRSFTALVCAFALAGIGSAAIVGGTTPAYAQEKKKADPKKKDEAPKQNTQQPPQQNVLATKWTKLCQTNDQSKKETCVVTQNLHSETGQMLAAVTVIEEKGAQKLFRIAVPLGMLLEPGLRVVIDQNPPLEAKYAICVPDGCFADLQINDDFVGNLKKGKALIVQTINHVGRTVNITFPLTDFGKSYDGPAIDPKEIQAQKQKLDEAVKNQAKEALKRRLEEQQKNKK